MIKLSNVTLNELESTHKGLSAVYYIYAKLVNMRRHISIFKKDKKSIRKLIEEISKLDHLIKYFSKKLGITIDRSWN